MSTESLSTEQLLRRYVSGALTAPEEAELERRATTDEGLREALFGYRQSPAQDHQTHIVAMVQRAQPAAVRRPLMRYAAAATILVLLGIATLSLPRYFNRPEEVAMEPPPVESQELPPARPAEPLTAPPPANTAPAPRRPNEAPTVTSAEPPREEEATEATAAAAAELADEVMAENKILPPPAVLRAPILLDEGADLRLRSSSVSPPVRGRVTTEDGRPLPGATILRPGMATGEVTDSSGAFVLPYDATLRTFTVTRPGYEAEEVEVIDPTEPIQLSLTEVPDTKAQDRWLENAARQQVDIEPLLPQRTRARPTEGLQSLKARIERDRPAQVPAGRVRVSFLVHPDGSLSDFRFRGRPGEATMEYVGTTLVESSVWEVEGASAGDGGADVGRPVRVYLKLRFD